MGYKELNKVHSELNLIREKYPDLKQSVDNGEIILRGKFGFRLYDPQLNKPPISDRYTLEITIHDGFPEKIPTVRETAGKIERSYEHIGKDGELCLGIKSELYQLLKRRPTIEGFIDYLLKPTLFAYSFFKKYKYMPWGERPGGYLGIFSRYVELFGTSDVSILIALLEIVLRGKYEGESKCPCDSGKTLNECHGEKIFEIWNVPTNLLVSEYEALKDFKLIMDITYENIFYRKFTAN